MALFLHFQIPCIFKHNNKKFQQNWLVNIEDNSSFMKAQLGFAKPNQENSWNFGKVRRAIKPEPFEIEQKYFIFLLTSIKGTNMPSFIKICDYGCQFQLFLVDLAWNDPWVIVIWILEFFQFLYIQNFRKFSDI